MLGGNTIKPEALLDLFSSGLSEEKEELNIRLLTGYISNIYWQFISVAARQSLSGRLETILWNAMQQQTESNNKKQLFKAYQDIYVSKDARNRLYTIWSSQQAPKGIKLTEDDYTSLAFALALRDDKDHTILTTQRERINNPDRKKRFEFIIPAVSSDAKQRDEFFNSLLKKQNRQRESNVLAALYYLHHPLRQGHDVAYLQQSLELLEEIQVTGDIFFPQSWLQATLGLYQSTEAADIVRNFIKLHPDYNPKLKAKVLQTADNLFRAEKILSD